MSCIWICVCGCFQERSLFCVKQMVAADPLQSIPVYENTCWFILVSEADFTAEHVFVTTERGRHHVPWRTRWILLGLKRLCVSRREAASLWDLWEDVLSVWQQKRPHEEETRRGGTRQWKQRSRSLVFPNVHTGARFLFSWISTSLSLYSAAVASFSNCL